MFVNDLVSENFAPLSLKPKYVTLNCSWVLFCPCLERFQSTKQSPVYLYLSLDRNLYSILLLSDMEDECYPAMPASAWSSRRRSSDSPPREVKAEPKSEPESPTSSCPPSPTPGTPVTHLDYVIDHTVSSFC